MLRSICRRISKRSIFSKSERNFSLYDGEYYSKMMEENAERDTLKLRRIAVKGKKKETYNIEIYGVPLNPLRAEEGELNEELKALCNPFEGNVFIQQDPTKYLYASRQVSSKEDSIDSKSPDVMDLLKKDPLYPFGWEETLVDPEVISRFAARGNQNSDDNLLKTIEKLNSKSDNGVTTDKVTQPIFDVVFDNQPSPYYDIHNAVLANLLSGNQMYLGGMSKYLRRLILGNTVPLENLTEMFTNCVDQAKKVRETGTDLTTAEIFRLGYPDVYFGTESLYQLALMKSMVFESGENLRAFVGIEYCDAIADNWDGDEIKNIKFEELLGIPARVETENVDVLLEKYALLDVLFDDNLWNQPIITDPFPYLTPEENNDSTILELKKKYFVNFKKYSVVKDKILPPKSK